MRDSEGVGETPVAASSGEVGGEEGNFGGRKSLAKSGDGEAVEVAVGLVPPGMEHEEGRSGGSVRAEEEVLLVELVALWEGGLELLELAFDLLDGD